LAGVGEGVDFAAWRGPGGAGRQVSTTCRRY